MPSAQPRSAFSDELRRIERKEERKRKRVELAADFCADVVTDSWQAAVADRAAEYVSDGTLKALFARHRRRRCKLLARIAQTILRMKEAAHDAVGSAGAWLAAWLGGDLVVQTFARELSSRIPLPQDAQLIATARGLQVTGVLLCVVREDDLTRCECFRDLALAESKERLKAIFEAAAKDWTGLARFPAANG